MLGLKSKDKTNELKEEIVEEVVKEAAEEIAEESASTVDAAVQEVTELSVSGSTEVSTAVETTAVASKGQDKPANKDSKKENADGGVYEKFPDLAKLMNTTVEELRDEFFLFQIRKLMSRIGKVIVRYNVSEQEVERIFLNAAALSLNQVSISPVYLPVCERLVKRHKLHQVCVSSIVDFPFGESSFKSKLHNVKDAVRVGVDEVSVTLPTMLFSLENAKVLKKQIKKVGRSYKNSAGVLLNATDLDEEQIKRAMKFARKSKVTHITFAFGEATLEEVKSKLEIVNKYKNNKKIAVLANVDRAESVMELFKLEVDRILTPYADAIGDELIKRFEIKSVKLY
jgi:deoxyribose-phosphate aldolase